MQGSLVYVVDDDKDVLGSIGCLLRSLRLDCRTYNSGEALLAAIASLPPGCILTDLRMPGLSGLELQAELLRRGFNWPIVFMTGHGDTPTVVQAIQKGAVEFIEKPFSDERLLSALHAGFASLTEKIEETNSSLAEVRTALQRDGIFPYYQPKVRLATGEAAGFEALIRWGSSRIRTNTSLIHDAFEDRGLAKPLAERMIDGILTDVAAWIRGGIAFGHVAINASSVDLEDEGFPARLLAKMEKRGIPSGAIHVEVTEGVSVRADAAEVNKALAQLRAQGIKIALDDFGTGYASLAHLQDLPFDYIKIDRSFIDRFKEPSTASIIKAMIGLARGLGKDIVAEGVEREDQASFLIEHGCEFGQGFLYNKAVSADDVPKICSLSSGWRQRARAAPPSGPPRAGSGPAPSSP